jgi:hypothetical protein
MHIRPWQKMGIWPVRDEQAGVPPHHRLQMLGAVIHQRPSFDDTDDPKKCLIEVAKEKGLAKVGDIHPWFFWQTSGRGFRGTGSIAQAFASMTVMGGDGGFTHHTGTPVSPSGVYPVRYGDGATDWRYRPKFPGWPKCYSTLPRGINVITMAGTEEGNQHEYMLHADPRIVCPSVGGPGEAGTLFVDLQPDAEMCMDGHKYGPGMQGRAARVQTFVRVIAMRSSTPGLGVGRGNTMAWNLSTTTQERLAGFGMCWAKLEDGTVTPPTGGPVTPRRGPPKPPPGPITGGGVRPAPPRGGFPPAFKRGPGGGIVPAGGGPGSGGTDGLLETGGGRPEVGGGTSPGYSGSGSPCLFGQFQPKPDPNHGIGLMAQIGGSGPFTAGAAGDKHWINTDRDGNPIISGHLSDKAYFFMDRRRDGPLWFRRMEYPDPKPLPLINRVHLVWDDEPQHPWLGGARQGYWKWFGEYHVVNPKKKKVPNGGETPPKDPPGPKTPGPGVPRPGGPTTPPAGPGNPPRGGTPYPRPGGPHTGGRGVTIGGPKTGGPRAGIVPPFGPPPPGSAGPRPGPITPPAPPGKPPRGGAPQIGPPVPPSPPGPTTGGPAPVPGVPPFGRRPGGKGTGGTGGHFDPRRPERPEGPPPLGSEPWEIEHIGGDGGPSGGGTDSFHGGTDRGGASVIRNTGAAGPRDISLWELFHPFAEGFAQVSFRPQRMRHGDVSFLHNPDESAQRYEDEEETRPQVLVFRAWGGQADTGEWIYQRHPNNSRARGGTAHGGLLLTPPSYMMEDYLGINSGVNVRAVETASYLAAAPGVAFALGTPHIGGGLDQRSVLIAQMPIALDPNESLLIQQLDASRVGQNLLRGYVSGTERYIQIGGVQGLQVPRGTTGERPTAPASGEATPEATTFRVNRGGTEDTAEFWDETGAEWRSLLATGGGVSPAEVVEVEFSEEWSFAYQHNRGERPGISVVDSDGLEVEVAVRHTANRVTIFFRGTLNNAKLLLQ